MQVPTGPSTKQRLAGSLHTSTELLAVVLEVLVDCALNEFGLLEPGHQGGAHEA